MDSKQYLTLLGYLFLHILLVANCATYSDKNPLCSQAPYPELCNSLMITTTNAQVEKTQDQNSPDFRDVSLIATLSQAKQSHNLISQIDLTALNELEKSAWTDCLELYEDTIYQLNRSLASKDGQNAQTWLSAAIANEEACKNGFLDFNLSSPLHNHFMQSDGFSKYLSNSLYINKASSSLLYDPNQNKHRRLLSNHDEVYFPAWVSHGDRKLLQTRGGASVRADMVVAQDGSGDYRTISQGLAAVGTKRSGNKRFVIYVKKGIYKENVEVKRSMKNIMFVGDGIDATVVTGSKNVQDGSTTFRSATFAVTGDGFIARGMTFENTAGPQKHQAVALRSGADFSVFYECSFKGYQDTLYVYSQRQFYRNCDIYGTIDFIFGDAAAVIQNSNIYLRSSGQKNTVTAQGRKDPNENTGIIIHNSRVTGSGGRNNYLGRPWQKYSRTVFMKCVIDRLIDPAGWMPWSGDFALSTLYYGEYMNTGAGAGTGGRVKWPGFHVIRSVTEAGKFSVGNFLAGGSWIPATGVPYTAGV